MNKNIKPQSLFGRIKTSLTEAVFPGRCIFCEDFFHPSDAYDELRRKNFYRGYFEYDLYELFQDLMIPFLCPGCSRDFSPIAQPVCFKCGLTYNSAIRILKKIIYELHSSAIHGDITFDYYYSLKAEIRIATYNFYKKEGWVCYDCLKKPNLFGIARAVSLYEKKELFATLIRRFKYNEKIQLSKPLGKILFAAFIQYWDINEIDLVMPVPLHIKRFRNRGFNQAYLLIKDWHKTAKDFNMFFPFEKIDRNTLIRIKNTRPQVEFEGIEREENIKDAFNVRYPLRVKGKRILLIDDVYTTGSTVNECTKELMNSGAARVDILTLARREKEKGKRGLEDYNM